MTPCSASSATTTARAPLRAQGMLTSATRTTYGRQTLTGALITMLLTCSMAFLHLIGTGHTPTPFLCAVSWIWMCPSNGIKNNTYYLPWDRCPDCGTLQCGWAGSEGIQYCPGAANSNCNPDCYWSSTELTGGSSVYRAMCLRGGGFVRPQCDVESRCTYTYAFTVRCVLETTRAFSSFTGGGGGAGAYVKVKVPDEAILMATENNTNGRLNMRSGAGGAGGAKNSTVRGASGGSSLVELTNSAGTVIWSLEVQGGTGGSGATAPTATAEGKGGTYGAMVNVAADGSCIYTNRAANPQVVNRSMKCSDVPGIVSRTSGANGYNGGKGKNYNASTDNGKGGRAPAVSGTTSDTASGAGGSISSSNPGVTPSQGANGAGGGGGNCYTTNAYGTAVCGDGGKGGNGYINATYTPTCPGAGGGGGGAGVVLHLKNIPTGNLGGQYFPAANVSVGNGGLGGVEGYPGAKGTNTSITINGRKYEVTGGEGGNAATMCSISGGTITQSAPGTKGNGGKVTSASTNNMETPGGPTSWTAVPASADDYIEATDGKSVENYYTDPNNTGTLSKIIAAGGNGGVVKSLSDAETGTLLTYPCGGWSREPDGVCNNSSYEPANLGTRYIDYEAGGWLPGNQYLNGGAPGGGGGSWEMTAGSAGFVPGEVSQGAKGTNGTIYMYFE